MSRPTPAATRRWQARLIVSVFVVAVAGAALAGWWYARDSSPHQGPIILISIDGLAPAAITTDDNANTTSSSIGALAADAVVFERAYTHSPLTLPAHASLLAGQLPFEHGVRDEAGFALREETRSLAELLRTRGFETGAAVSSFALRRESGIAQGFTFFDAQLPNTPPGTMPVVERDGAATMDAAATWLRARQGYRYFLFVQVGNDAAAATVTQVVAALKADGLYEQATIVLTSDRGPASTGLWLDEASLRVPLLIKQPNSEGAGRRLAVQVQHLDILPTILDLVRAPIPSGMRGRSLRALLGGDTDILPAQPIYAESLAGQFRLGTTGAFALANQTHRYVRGSVDKLVALETESARSSDATPDEADGLRQALDRLLDGHPVVAPTPLADADEERFAALGFLKGAPMGGSATAPMEPGDEPAVATKHRAAARLVAERKYSMAIDALRDITRVHPQLAVVHYQTGSLLARAGRLPEADHAFRAAASIAPDSTDIQVALAELLLREGREADAAARAALAVALAEHQDGRARASAHWMAVLVALARDDEESAQAHAVAAEIDDPTLPMVRVVAGRLAHTEGRYEEALTAFESAAATLTRGQRALEGVYWHLGEILVRLNRGADAEKAFREELRAFPRGIRAYTSLAMAYHAADRADAVRETLDALLVAVPTPEGYDAAARTWTAVGHASRATALRTAARTRFRGDPSLAVFQRRR